MYYLNSKLKWLLSRLFFGYIILLMSSKVSAQKDKIGELDSNINSKVQWSQSATWQEVLAKAEQDGKLIFVDCYATWCVPCKKMDTLVYSKNDVYENLNGRFVSVKLQMDSTSEDGESVKKWRQFSSNILQQYNVSALPTFLFFNSKGDIVHKGIGFKNAHQFIKLLEEANDSTKQYYTLLSKYNSLAPSQVRELAKLAKAFSDSENTSKVARYYMEKVLALSPLDTMLNKNNLVFINQFVGDIHTYDELFKRFLHLSWTIDSIANRKGYSREIVNYVVYNEYVEPLLKRCQKEKQAPKWDMLYASIAKQFGDNIAKKQVVDGKVFWFQSKKDRVHYVKYLIEQANIEISTKQKVSSLTLNNWAWDIFGLSNNTNQLREALKIINLALIDNPKDPALLDTKANILYKMGYVNKAIEIQEKVISYTKKENSFYDLFLSNLKKMKSQIPTWSLGWD